MTKKTTITEDQAHEAAIACAHYGCQMMVNVLQNTAVTAANEASGAGSMKDGFFTPSDGMAGGAEEKTLKQVLTDSMSVASAGAQAYVTARKILLNEIDLPAKDTEQETDGDA